MNTYPGLIGKKLGNTQIFEDDGNVRRVTAIEVRPCTVLGKRTAEKDGYSALIVGLGERREKLVKKPEARFFKKTGQKPARVVRELRLAADEVAKHEVCSVLKPSDLFSAGQLVDVSGQTKGRVLFATKTLISQEIIQEVTEPKKAHEIGVNVTELLSNFLSFTNTAVSTDPYFLEYKKLNTKRTGALRAGLGLRMRNESNDRSGLNNKLKLNNVNKNWL